MFSATLREWKRKIEQLRQRWRAVRQENERLRKENEVLRRREKQWERERERLREENDRLRQQLEEAQRANKRQAAPFSRGMRKRRGASRVRLMVDDTANSLPSRWTKSFPCPCLGGVAAGGAWSSIGPSRNISRKSCARPSGDASISTSAIVRSATNECKGAIRDRPLTL